MAGCFDISGYLPSTQETTESGLTTYHITVRTHSGQYLPGVGVRVFADTDMTEIIWYDKTDESGKMSFIADTFDGYVVALENIPDGYAAAKYYALTGENSEIILSIGLQTNVDLNTTVLNLGSAMVDMTFAAADGNEYTVSQLLASKKAVVLYFFDSGAADTLSNLEAAWKSYADEVAVLALNPVDADVSAYAEGRSLPIAACDRSWINALGLSKFPTTVVVDRYGVISLIHAGTVETAKVFRDVFAFFARNDYTPELMESIDTIIGKEMLGTANNPYIIEGASADIMASVAPGGMAHYKIYDVQDMILQLSSANAWIQYEGEAYYPENGVITLVINTPDEDTPVSLAIGNAGSHTELFVARLSYQKGTENNPHPVEQGQFTAQLEAGDEDGIYYMYKAIKPGTLRFSCVEQTEKVKWSYTAINRNSGIRINSEEDVITDELTGEQFMLLEVTANDVVIIHVATEPDKQGEYPAGSFRIQFLYEGENGGTDEPVKPGKETTYSVTVQDSYGTPLSGVSVVFTDATGTVTVLTDAAGTASYTNALGSVSVSIVPLRLYTVPKSEFTLNSNTNNVSVVFTGKMETVPTILSIGNAYPVVEGENYAVMNAGALNFFLFTPNRTGLFRFRAEGTLGFWGTDVNNITNQISQCFMTEDGFTLNVDSQALGKPHILSITGIPNTTLTINRVGDVAPDPDTYPVQQYTPKHQPQAFTMHMEPGKQLHYADITAPAGSYQLVLDPQTGIYHLNTLDGPVVYVNLGANAPYFSLSQVAATAMVMCSYDENGYIQSKLDFAPCMVAYIRCMDAATGHYPLTEDLLYILQTYGTYAGWYDGNSANYIFRSSAGVNPANAWMFALCWMA